MLNLQNVLAAADFSSSSLLAIDRGFLVARLNHAKYSVMHALDTSTLKSLEMIAGSTLDVDKLRDQILTHTRDELSEFVSESEHTGTYPVELFVDAEPATQAIPARASRLHANLVIVGAHGKGFLQRVLIGSTATRLLRTVHCPVLLVKKPARFDYRRVLIGIDFSEVSASNIRFAKQLAPAANMILLHAYEVPFEGKMRLAGVEDSLIAKYRDEARTLATLKLRDLARRCGLQEGEYSSIVCHGDAARSVIQIEEQHRCDLIVMGKHGSNATTDLMLGSVTKRVLADCTSDTVVVTGAFT